MKLRIQSCKTGKGAFAGEDIARGARIIAMTGRDLTEEQADRLIRAGKLRPDDPLQVGEHRYRKLDRVPYFFNHSCEPNAAVRGRGTLVALRDIAAGEQITYDYSAVVCTHNTGWQMRCRCGSAQCRKTIGSVETLPASVLARYQKAGALMSYIARELARL